MIKFYLSEILKLFFIFLFFYFIFILGNNKFTLNNTSDSSLPSFRDRSILVSITFFFILGFMIFMIMFGGSLIGLNARYTEAFKNNDDIEGFVDTIACSNKMEDQKLFCSQEYKKSLFTNLVSIDKKIDFLMKKFEKSKKS